MNMTAPSSQTATQALLDELQHWGGDAEMSAFESVMWRSEIDPRLRSTTTSVLLLDRVPDWQRLLQGHQWVMGAVPRLRQRVVVPLFGIGAPTWVDDPDFDLDYHLRRTRLPEPGSQRQLYDLAQTLAMTPFDKARAPWEGMLVEGLEGGRAAYILKLHHAVSDGLGIIQLLSRILSRSAEPMARPSLPAKTVVDRAPSPGALAARQWRRSLQHTPRDAMALKKALAQAAASCGLHGDSANEGLQYLSSARRVLAMRPVRGSSLLKRRSLSWRFDSLEIPLLQMKAAAKAADASVNDVFLAGLIGGFRRYHEQLGVPVDTMPIGFPISLRTAKDPMGGNRFAGSQYAAPVAETDPLARIRHIQTFVSTVRAEPALDIMLRLMPLVSRLPLAAVTAMIADYTVAQDAQISNIPGIAHPVYLAGAEVTHFMPFAPVPGCGMMIAMISHNGRCCIGINTDRAAVTEPELLLQSFQQGLDEVLALATPTPR